MLPKSPKRSRRTSVLRPFRTQGEFLEGQVAVSLSFLHIQRIHILMHVFMHIYVGAPHMWGFPKIGYPFGVLMIRQAYYLGLYLRGSFIFATPHVRQK